MDCPYCKYDTLVLDTKHEYKTNQIYRRRVCVNCSKRFTTREHLRDDYKYKGYANAQLISAK
jgi:transcriptional regulator NrdR family protein